MHILWHLPMREDFTLGVAVAAVSSATQILLPCQRMKMVVRTNQNQN